MSVLTNTINDPRYTTHLKYPVLVVLVLIQFCVMETKLITATLKYFSKSGNSAFITTKSNPFSMDSICGYILADPISNLEPGATFEIP